MILYLIVGFLFAFSIDVYDQYNDARKNNGIGYILFTCIWPILLIYIIIKYTLEKLKEIPNLAGIVAARIRNART